MKSTTHEANNRQNENEERKKKSALPKTGKEGNL